MTVPHEPNEGVMTQTLHHRQRGGGVRRSNRYVVTALNPEFGQVVRGDNGSRIGYRHAEGGPWDEYRIKYERPAQTRQLRNSQVYAGLRRASGNPEPWGSVGLRCRSKTLHPAGIRRQGKRGLPMVLCAALLLLGSPPAAAAQEDPAATILAGLDAGELAAQQQESVGPFVVLALLGGAVSGYFSADTYEAERDILLASLGTGVAAGVIGYALAGFQADPPVALLPEERGAYRDAFIRGYRERVKEIRRNRALMAGLAWAAGHALLASSQADFDEGGGVIISFSVMH